MATTWLPLASKRQIFDFLPRVRVFSFGHWYAGRVLQVTPKRILVRYTTGTGVTRDRWYGRDGDQRIEWVLVAVQS